MFFFIAARRRWTYIFVLFFTLWVLRHCWMTHQMAIRASYRTQAQEEANNAPLLTKQEEESLAGKEAMPIIPTTRTAAGPYHYGTNITTPVHSVESQSTNVEREPLATKILAFCNEKYQKIGLFWYRNVERLGYTQHELVVTDDATQTWFHKQGIKNVRLFHFPLCSTLSGGETTSQLNKEVLAQNLPRGKPPNQDRSYRRQFFARRWLETGQVLRSNHVLLTDVDNYLTSYQPLDVIEQGDVDLYLAYETAYPQDVYYATGFTTCGGWMWLRGNHTGVQQVVSQLLDWCGCSSYLRSNRRCDKACKCDDQVLWNRLLWNTTLEGRNGVSSPYRVIWDNNPPAARLPPPNDQMEHWPWKGQRGVLVAKNDPTKTILRLAIWDRSLAYRGPIPNRTEDCPQSNWVTMPIRVADRTRIPLDWDAACPSRTPS